MLFTLTLEGNLAADPVLRHTNSGIAVCEIRLLHNARRRGSDGGWTNGRTLAIDVACWRDLATRVSQLRKGDTVIVDCADDLRAEAYGQHTNLRVTANAVAVSMRFAAASSHRRPKPAGNGDTVRTPEGEHFEAAEHAEYTADRQAAMAAG